MKILITYALEQERGSIQIPGCSVTFCCTGIGKVSTAINTFEALLLEKPDLVLNVGTSGTLKHRVGDIVICSTFIDRDLEKIAEFGVNYQLDFTEEVRSKRILNEFTFEKVVSTGDTFQTDEATVGVQADVFDMEAYAGAQVCKKLGVPYLSVKYVTDVIGQNSIKHWEEKLQDARESLACFLNTLPL